MRDADIRDGNMRDVNTRDANTRDAKRRDTHMRDADMRALLAGDKFRLPGPRIDRQYVGTANAAYNHRVTQHCAGWFEREHQAIKTGLQRFCIAQRERRASGSK